MARNTNQILQSIINAIQSDTTLSGLTSTSQTALWRLYAYIVSVALATEEQLSDQFITDVEAIVAKAAPGTAPWIQAQAFLFQYNATTPQIIQLNPTTFAPYYTTVNTTYRIVTRCSVSPGPLNQVIIKLAKLDPPAPLSTPELQAIQSYFNNIKPAGLLYTCFSEPADKLYTAATVTYDGSYAGVISSNLLVAYQNYLKNIPFNSVIKVSDIEGVLRNVVGVIDVVINEMSARPDSAGFPYAGGSNLVAGNDWIQSSWSTIAGYIVDETTGGYDFVNSLTLLPR